MNPETQDFLNKTWVGEQFKSSNFIFIASVKQKSLRIPLHVDSKTTKLNHLSEALKLLGCSNLSSINFIYMIINLYVH